MHQPTTRHLAPALLLAFVATAVAQDGSPTSPVTSTFAGGPGAPFAMTIVHINEAGHPTNVVPGLGVPFKVGTGTSSAFQRPIYSEDGLHFGINALAETGSTLTDDCLLVDGVVIAQEGDPASWGLAGEIIGTIDTNFGLNNSGDVLFGNNVNGTAPTTADDYIVIYSGGAFLSLAKEGDAVTTWLPAITGGTAGTWDDTMDSCRLLNNGTPMWRATGIDGLTTGTTANDSVWVLGNGTAIQEGVDVPTGQFAGGTEAWNIFDLDNTYVSGDGSVLLAQGDLYGATTTDDVVTLNGTVIVQEGAILPGSGFAEPVDATGIVEAWLDRGSNFYVRGNNDVTETDWVYRNGVVVADSAGASEVVPGGGEVFDDTAFGDCFFAFDGNLSGAFIIGGVTDAATDTNGVLVYDDGTGNRVVVCREGDPVDLDGNGLFDDDRFINIFGNDDAKLLDDGSVVFVASLKNAAGASQSNGLFRVTPKTASCTQRNGSGINPVVCDCTTLPVLGSAWNVEVTPAANTLLTVLFAGFSPLPSPVPLFGGEALVAPPVSDLPVAALGSHSIVLPSDLSFMGIELFLQGVRVNNVGGSLELELTNAVDAVVSNN